MRELTILGEVDHCRGSLIFYLGGGVQGVMLAIYNEFFHVILFLKKSDKHAQVWLGLNKRLALCLQMLFSFNSIHVYHD